MSSTAPATASGATNGHSAAAPPSAANIGNLANKVALITGGSSGLGRAIAQAYVAAGAFVVSADLTPNPPKTPLLQAAYKGTDWTTPTVDLLNAQYPARGGHPVATYVRLDVTDHKSVEAAVAATVAAYGRLDIMVNNAGVAAESKTAASFRVHECPIESWDVDMAVNGRGVWLGCKYAAAQMLAQTPHASGDRGWIINMCSILGLVGAPGLSPYCATKGAVLQMTKAIGLEYAKDRIHVNCIHPGFTETSMVEALKARDGPQATHAFLESIHPWGRLGLADDIAKCAVFLAGDGASWITGQSFVVDGGYVAM